MGEQMQVTRYAATWQLEERSCCEWWWVLGPGVWRGCQLGGWHPGWWNIILPAADLVHYITFIIIPICRGVPRKNRPFHPYVVSFCSRNAICGGGSWVSSSDPRVVLMFLPSVGRRGHQNCPGEHGPRGEGAVLHHHPGQRHGGSGGRSVRVNHRQHHANGCQRQPAQLPPEYASSTPSYVLLLTQPHFNFRQIIIGKIAHMAILNRNSQFWTR